MGGALGGQGEARGLMTQVPARFVELMTQVTREIGDAALDARLAERLTDSFPPGGAVFDEIEGLCRQGHAEGWLCAGEHGGIRFGRPVQAGEDTHGFSVDVVDMADIEGPHHTHPHGEIDMIMPIDGEARFDGAPRGWTVYEPGSSHHPTVQGGRALILYLLPQGAIEFTRT